MIRNSIFLLIVLIAVSSCDQTSESSSTKDLSSKTSIQSEFVVLDKFGQEVNVFSVGEEITFELRVKNTENFSLDYSFTSPGYSIEVTESDTPVWSANYGLSFAQVVTNATIGALQNKTITKKWNTVDNDGIQVSPGNYTITPGIAYFVNGEAIAAPSPVDIVLN
jgi:hypothetical protein